MTRDPEMEEVVRREVGEALDELLELTEALTEGTLAPGDFVRDAFRIFHNTKGALRLGGFSSPEKVAHVVEDHLADLREQGAVPGPELVGLMEQALSACVYAVEADGEHEDLPVVLQKLAQLNAAAPPEAKKPTATKKNAPSAKKLEPKADLSAPKSAAPSGPESTGDKDEMSVQRDESASGSGSLREAIRIDATRLSRLMDLGSEYLAQHARGRRQRARLREFSDRLASLQKKGSVLRDALGPMASDFENFVRLEEQELRRATQLTADFDRAMREVRMQPLTGIVPQLRRVVAEASRELNKSAHLAIDFGEVELDREVLDALREPLMHLLRNAVDHGLELPEEREAAGKAVRGEVRVSARVVGANVEISVEDDGRGANVERLRARAVETGLLPEGDAHSDEELMDLVLFAPGFSTASRVTSISGRGVGLDVVRSRVTELGGLVYAKANSRSGGLRFALSVPSSVVSMRGLSVLAGGACFVLPSAQVERTLRVRFEEIGSAEGVTVMRTPEGEPLRLRWLSSEMGAKRAHDERILQVVVVTEGSLRLGLVVDEVQGDTTFVIKRLPWNVRKAHGVIGATHQGDAALALVVDMNHLFRGQSSASDEHRLRVAPRSAKLRILVTDDSLTSRTLERNILIGAGYDVRVEEDGEAALRALESETFDLLVSDVQMPLMDGLQLTRCVRAHPRLSRLPIILVTSLDRPEDVALGAEAGADEYIVKGRFDQESLLKAVSRLL